MAGGDTKKVMRLVKIQAVQRRYKALSQPDKNHKIYPRSVRLDMIMLEFYISTHTVEDFLAYNVAEMIAKLSETQENLFLNINKKRELYYGK